jgi:single-strand DNA-binding protein
VDCRAFGRQAENINKYLSKGRPVFIEGRLTFDSWTAQDGTKRSRHRVTVESFQFLPGGGGSTGGQTEKVPDGQGRGSEQPASGPAGQSAADDIPF